jgi:hypothetical protein
MITVGKLSLMTFPQAQQGLRPRRWQPPIAPVEADSTGAMGAFVTCAVGELGSTELALPLTPRCSPQLVARYPAG